MKEQVSSKNLMLYLEKKKKIGVAYLLWFMLGTFGVHRFYLEKKGDGIGFVELALTLAAIASFLHGDGLWIFLLPAASIFCFVDLFLIPSLAKKSNLEIMDGLNISLDDVKVTL